MFKKSLRSPLLKYFYFVSVNLSFKKILRCRWLSCNAVLCCLSLHQRLNYSGASTAQYASHWLAVIISWLSLRPLMQLRGVQIQIWQKRMFISTYKAEIKLHKVILNITLVCWGTLSVVHIYEEVLTSSSLHNESLMAFLILCLWKCFCLQQSKLTHVHQKCFCCSVITLLCSVWWGHLQTASWRAKPLKRLA